MSEPSNRLYYVPPTCVFCDAPPVCRTADGLVCDNHRTPTMAAKIDRLEAAVAQLREQAEQRKPEVGQ